MHDGTEVAKVLRPLADDPTAAAALLTGRATGDLAARAEAAGLRTTLVDLGADATARELLASAFVEEAPPPAGRAGRTRPGAALDAAG